MAGACGPSGTRRHEVHHVPAARPRSACATRPLQTTQFARLAEQSGLTCEAVNGIDTEALVTKNQKRAVEEGGGNWDGAR
jgi:hypothetical protein